MADKTGTHPDPPTASVEANERRLPPIQQYWINRLIRARRERGDTRHIRDMLEFAGYPAETIAAAERWAESNPIAEPRILHLRNYLDPELCQRLIDDGDISAIQAGSVTEQRGSTLSQVKSEARIVDALPWRRRLKDAIMLIQSICREQVNAFFGTSIAQFEYPGLYRYRPGGHYEAHVDADAKNSATGCWYRQHPRDFSLVIYLNDAFSGGNLVFDNFGVSIRPGLGDVVCFPSDFRYIHAAKPVSEGERFCMVTWLQTHDSVPVPYREEGLATRFVVG